MKAQAGLEILMIGSIIIAILIFAFVSSVRKNSEVDFIKSYLSAQKICYETKNIINQISADSFGSAIKFNIPNKLETFDFNLTLNSTDKIIAVDWNGNRYSCAIITQNVTNSTHYAFQVKKGDNVAKNIDGVVVIEGV